MPTGRGRLLIAPAVAAAIVVAGVSVPPVASAAPPSSSPFAGAGTPTAESERGSTPDLGSPVPSADADAQAAAREDAPAIDIAPDLSDPLPDDELGEALEEAARTGEEVELVSETTETSISLAQPDGTVRVDTAAAPVRTKLDGQWVEVDTTLAVTEAGVQPAAVPGEITFSAGGDTDMAVLGDGEDTDRDGASDTSISLSWPEELPTPQLEGDTATYPEVFPGVDLVLTATRSGFTQLLVVNSRPDAGTLAELSSLPFPVTTTGAEVTEGAGNSLEVTESGTGEVVGSAVAPVMWDARTDPRTDQPVKTAPLGMELAAATEPGTDSTLVLTPPQAFLTDPATVYPVTIDPTAVLGALGDTFVQSNINTPRATIADLPVGTFDGGATRARSLLRFDVAAVKNRVVQSANLSMWEYHSWSCTPTWVDIRDAGAFDPATVTWANQPSIGGLVGNALVAKGYNSSCPAGTVNFDLTSWAQVYANTANGKPDLMTLAVTASSETDNNGWKKFNSAESGGGVPQLSFTYDGTCDQYGGFQVCGQIRDRYYALGGATGPLGLPTSNETPITGGAFNHFQGGDIYWSPATGAHRIGGAIRTKWGQYGYETGFLGFPTTDETAVTGGAFNHFTGGSIYWSQATGAHTITGQIRDKWGAAGWENSALGFPVTDETAVTGGAYNDFQNGSIYWSPANGAHTVSGLIGVQWVALGRSTGYLGFPASDEYTIASGARQDFTGGRVTWDSLTAVTTWDAGPSAFAGTPGWASTLGFQLSDTLKASVNVANGNLNLSMAGITVPGVGGDRGIGITYNSMATATGSVDPTGLLGTGMRLSESPDVRMVGYPDGSVRYIDATGRAAVYEWDGTKFASPAGDGGTKLEKSGTNWVLTTLASNRVQTFRTSDGLMTSDAERNGVAYTFTYTAAGKPTSITGTRGGAAVTFTIGGTGVPTGYLGQMTQTVDGTARTMVFGYNAAGRLTSVTDASGKTTTLGWTGTDITSIAPPSGKTTAVSYDTGHRVTQVVRDAVTGGINATTKLAYTTVGGLLNVQVTDPGNHVSTHVGDALGKIVKVTDALGNLQSVTYDANNDVATAVGAMPGNTTTFGSTGAAGGFMPTGATSATGAKTQAGYPTSGTGPQRYVPTTTTDTENNPTSISADARGNVTQQTSGGVTTSTTYNPAAGTAMLCGGKPGQPCTTTDGKNQTTNYTYDSSGNLTTVTPPAAGVIEPTTVTYDGAGRTKTVTDGKGQVTTYLYDRNDRVTQVRYNGATSCATAANCEVYGYDDNGNLTSRVDAAGTTTWTYDALDRQSGQTTPQDSGWGSMTTALAYDLAGNLSSYEDWVGITRYGYDAGNNLTSLAEPGGSCTGTITGCTTYTYDKNNTRTQTTYPGGTTVKLLDFDASGRAREYKATTATGTVLMDFKYSFTNGTTDSGLVRSRSDLTVPGTAVQTYSYDPLNRLTRALEKVGTTTTASWSYCYDANGNRTYDSTSTAATVLCPGQTGGPTATYLYDATDALTSRGGNAFSYDANGAELTGSGATIRTGGTWNARGQLTSLTSNGSTTAFDYAGGANKERTGAGGTGYQNTALGVTLDTNDSGTGFIREPNGTLVAISDGTTSNYLITDRQGSTIALVDATGVKKNSYSYDPYGASRAKTETVFNPYQYIGGELDFSGLYHLQNRYYDPTIGRFTQPDPSGQETNVYAYGSSNPINFSDTSGLVSNSTIENALQIGIAAGGAIVTAAIGGAVATIAAAAVSAGLQTLVSCIFGCKGGVLRTLLINTILNFFLTSSVDTILSHAIGSVFLGKTKKFIASYIVDRALNYIVD